MYVSNFGFDLSQGNVSHNMGEFNMDAFAAPNAENTSDANHAEYMDVATLRSFELDRDDLRFVRLLGSGNFGEVFKATMRNETVAVKSLKGEISIVACLAFFKHY